MTLYLPIAELSVNWIVIVGLGALVGFLSGMFGVGGGFLTTPLLIFYGIPPAVAVASSATQITGASVSGALAYWRRGGVDFKMGGVLVAGGFIGAGLGSVLFRWLQQLGQIDVTINIVYVLLLGTVGGLMLRESLSTMRRTARGVVPQRHRHNPFIAALPWKMRFYKSGLYVSPLAPLALGAIVGILTVSLGVGGGFIMVPAMIYLLGMSTNTVLGTSLFQIIFVTAATTMLHSVESQTVDIILAGLLLIGGVIGAQLGVRAAQRLSPVRLRLGLALILLAVAGRLAIGLTMRPAELFSIFGPA
ncbi:MULTISPECIES: sulfite exporter TauE/SafE family protein [Sphingosinicellaceae]|uniref:sulfite exporter TauE/SafE family protein n=1 Tax=Sphingosinicellaceae TaxID=2820280 RepID=UPI001C1E0EF5|nr:MULTISPECIES: sulfite exporter TauE/SafE family protein [Polymorphobacter]QYE35338.1 sulfite exporter TauE/SafE family protein [Polymorphobacter sp. PAMC 29334]UAJ11357.1 sulfite exporter TauE/SafE family protein [Polymorphobacter megasporae]